MPYDMVNFLALQRNLYVAIKRFRNERKTIKITHMKDDEMAHTCTHGYWGEIPKYEYK